MINVTDTKMCANYISEEVDLQPSLNSYLKNLFVDPDHLFRHLTEVNGKDTRVLKTTFNKY